MKIKLKKKVHFGFCYPRNLCGCISETEYKTVYVVYGTFQRCTNRTTVCVAVIDKLPNQHNCSIFDIYVTDDTQMYSTFTTDYFLRDSCPLMVENMSFCEAFEGNTGQVRGKEEEIHVALLAS